MNSTNTTINTTTGVYSSLQSKNNTNDQSINCSSAIDCIDHQALEKNICETDAKSNQTNYCPSQEYIHPIVSDVSKDDPITNEDDHSIPLDYRMDWSSEMENNLASCISSHPSILDLNNTKTDIDYSTIISLEILDSDVESLQSDTMETEENMSSIPQWVDANIWRTEPSAC